MVTKSASLGSGPVLEESQGEYRRGHTSRSREPSGRWPVAPWTTHDVSSGLRPCLGGRQHGGSNRPNAPSSSSAGGRCRSSPARCLHLVAATVHVWPPHRHNRPSSCHHRLDAAGIAFCDGRCADLTRATLSRRQGPVVVFDYATSPPPGNASRPRAFNGCPDGTPDPVSPRPEFTNYFLSRSPTRWPRRTGYDAARRHSVRPSQREPLVTSPPGPRTGPALVRRWSAIGDRAILRADRYRGSEAGRRAGPHRYSGRYDRAEVHRRRRLLR